MSSNGDKLLVVERRHVTMSAFGDKRRTMQIINPNDIGRVIREQRQRLGLDQQELANRVGVSRQWIVEIEHGKPRAEIGLVLKTINALNLGINIVPDRRSGRPSSSPLSDGRKGARDIDIDILIERARGRLP
jgi:HTH-type transcriptional regulator / antitoxin HipB